MATLLLYFFLACGGWWISASMEKPRMALQNHWQDDGQDSDAVWPDIVLPAFSTLRVTSVNMHI